MSDPVEPDDDPLPTRAWSNTKSEGPPIGKMIILRGVRIASRWGMIDGGFGPEYNRDRYTITGRVRTQSEFEERRQRRLYSSGRTGEDEGYMENQQ